MSDGLLIRWTLGPVFSARATRSAGATTLAIFARPTLAVGTAGATRATGPALAAGARSEVLVARQFPVAIFVELLQRGGRVGDFVGVNHAIVIRVERKDEGGLRSWTAGATLATGSARTISARSAFARRRAVLGDEQRRGNQGQA